MCRQVRQIGLQVARHAAVQPPRRADVIGSRLGQQRPRPAAEWQFAGQQLVQDHAEAVHVAPSVHGVRVADLLGTHVGGGAEELTIDRHRGLVGAAQGQAEVHEARGQGTGVRGQGRTA